jgi:hypothetical protein
MGKLLKSVGDILVFIGISAGISVGTDAVKDFFTKSTANSKLKKAHSDLAVDSDVTAVAYGAIGKFAAVLGLRNQDEIEACVYAVRLMSNISPQALNALYTNGTLSNLDDAIKFADYTVAKSWNGSGISPSLYMQECMAVIGSSPLVADKGSKGDTEFVMANTPGGKVPVPKDSLPPNVDPAALGEGATLPWYTFANVPAGVKTTDVGTNNVGVTIPTWLLQQALILAGFGRGVFEGQNLPLLQITGVSSGSSANAVYFNQLLGDYCEAIYEPRRTSYGIKVVYQLYKDIIAVGESSAIVDACKSQLAALMDQLDPAIKTSTDIYGFKRPRDKYAYGSVTAQGSETDKWNNGTGSEAKMIDIERALIDIGYMVGWNTPQTNRGTWGEVDDDAISGGTVDGKLRLAQGTNGAYRNQPYSWVTVNNVARALADSDRMTDAQVKTWYQSRAWTVEIGKALRQMLLDNAPTSVMLTVFDNATYPVP